jgi:hypothetical protein
MLHALRRTKMYVNFCSKSQKKRDYYEDLEVGGRIILSWIVEKFNEMVWTGFIWLRIRTSDGLL